MRWLYIAGKDLRILARDRMALSISLLMPFLLMVILSFALAPVFKQNAGIPRFSVGFADADGGQLATALKDVFALPQLKELVDLQPGSAEDLRRQVQAGKLPAAIIVPRGFSEAILSAAGGPGSQRPPTVDVVVLSDPGQGLRAGIVQSVVEGFTRQVTAARFGTESAITQLIASGAVPPAEAGALGQQLGPRLAQPSGVDVNLTLVAPRQGVTAGQYYAAGMGVMFLFFGAMFGAGGFKDERDAHTLERLLSTPTPPGAVVAGKLVAVLIGVFAQLTILILATRWLLGVHWGNPLGVALVGGAAAFAATGVVIFIAAVSPTQRAADTALQLVTQFSALLGGSMIPLAAFPEGLRFLTKFTVNGWALAAFQDLMAGKALIAVVTPVLVLAGIGLLFGALGTWRLTARTL